MEQRAEPIHMPKVARVPFGDPPLRPLELLGTFAQQFTHSTAELDQLARVAVRGGKRCRMHGGAAGSGAPTGNRNAFRHGRYTRELLEFKRSVRELLRGSTAKLELV